MLVRSILLSWSALPLRLNHTKAVLLPKVSTYIFTLHQPTLKPNIGGKTNCVGVVPETVKLLIGVK